MSAAAATLAPFSLWQFRTDPVRRSEQPAPRVQNLSPASPTAGTMQGVHAEAADAKTLVGRCLGGDGPAWVELVRAHQSRVYTLCYRFTGSPQDAEDLTQDVFLKIYSSLHAFDAGRGSLGVWVTTMTRNHLVDHYRRSRLQRASQSLDAGWDEPASEAAGIPLEDRRPGPHAHALQRELEREVQQALTRVSPELREAVILRDLQDLDYREIAAVLRIPEGTVKSRISRGRAELARALGRKGREVS